MKLLMVGVLCAFAMVAQAADIGKEIQAENAASDSDKLKVCYKECGKCLMMLKKEAADGQSKGAIVLLSRGSDGSDPKGLAFVPAMFKAIKADGSTLVSLTAKDIFNQATFDASSAKKSFKAGNAGSDNIYASCMKLAGHMATSSTGDVSQVPTLKFEACLFPKGGVIQIEGESVDIAACSMKYNLEMDNLDFSNYENVELKLAAKPLMKKKAGTSQYEAARTMRGAPVAKACKKSDGAACSKNKKFEIDSDGSEAMLSTKVKVTKAGASATSADVTTGAEEDSGKKVPLFTFKFSKPSGHSNGNKWKFEYDPVFSTSKSSHLVINLFIIGSMISLINLF